VGDFLRDLVLTFVPLLIVIDALGNLPFVISMSEGMTEPERRKMVRTAVITATIVGLVFLFFGQLILRVMNISVGAFAIAGGIILLVLSVKYVSTGRMVEGTRDEMIAVVPIGTPLVVGPATITTLLLLATQFPGKIYLVLISFVLNMLITWLVFMFSSYIVRFMGEGGLRASSKVFSLLLAAIAVSMIIRGIDLIGLIKTTG
jgi:multiple antibiotic resistance protein